MYVKHFSGATTDCMKTIKPSLKNPLHHFILYVRTNDFISNQTSEEIATSIINLASSMKGESYDVSISSIIHRTDDKRLHQEGCKVNDHLNEKCKITDVYLIDNSNRIKTQHLNKSSLHLNKNGSRMLRSIFAREICKIVN